ncbi:MAG: Uracil-DNA glycosylase [Bacteroidota bacterium]|jgi:uracil-DNA glycosylase
MLMINEPKWKHALQEELDKPYCIELAHFVNDAYQNTRCYPPKELIFNAFEQCPLDQVKVVILGQDPYHGFGQANGLAFSVNDGVQFPPSLINIFKELASDCAIPIAISGNLERWASQGVLLLNSTLTVEENQAGSHQNKGWEQFTDAVIAKLSEEKSGLVFLLWGGFAKKKGAKIDRTKHLVLETGHPSPLSANRGLWFGNQHFSKTNTYLSANGQEPIAW